MGRNAVVQVVLPSHWHLFYFNCLVSDQHNKMNNTSLSAEGTFTGWHPAFIITCMAFYSLIITISLLGNILVCLAIFFNKSLRSSPTMSFIFSLASSDLLTACLSMPFDAENLLLSGAWKHSEILCIVWTTAYLFTVPTSMLTLVVLTFDRYKGPEWSS